MVRCAIRPGSKFPASTDFWSGLGTAWCWYLKVGDRVVGIGGLGLGFGGSVFDIWMNTMGSLLHFLSVLFRDLP